MSQTLSLFRLQQADTQIERIQSRAKIIQEMLEQDDDLQQALSNAQTAKENRLNAERNLRHAEAEVQDQRLKIEQVEASLYSGSVKNPKELQDLQNDVAALRRYLASLEDTQLEAMVVCEDLETADSRAQDNLKIVQEQVADKHRALIQEQAGLLKENEKFQAERAAIAGAIKAENLELYNQLRMQKRGVAVTGISENACDACGANLTPAQQQAARSVSQIIHCPSCGRILYAS